MIILSGWVDVDAARRDEALIAGRPHMEATRAWPGCLDYVWSADPLRDERIYVYERWADADSLASHFAGPHYGAMRDTIAAHGIRGVEVHKYAPGQQGAVYDSRGVPRADFFEAGSPGEPPVRSDADDRRRNMNPAAEDELAIRALVDRYCDAVNRRDRDAWLETWTDDPSWELFGRPMQGREEALQTLDGALAMLNFVVQTAVNPVIDVDGDQATGRWLVSEWSESEQLSRLLLMFIYHDEYARTNAGWRIASRRMQLLYQGPPDLSGKSVPPEAAGG